MVITATTYFGVSTLAFLVWVLVVGLEQARGRRLFLSSLRDRFDSLITWFLGGLAKRWRHFVRYVVRLNWYYSLHAMLQAFLRVIVTSYHYFEAKFENNRKKAKQLRAEKRKLKAERTHLEEVAVYREETKLTPEEQEKLKKRKLESDH
jgi:hypothetical protein